MEENLQTQLNGYKDTNHWECKSADDWNFRRGEMVNIEAILSLRARVNAALESDHQEDDYYDDFE